MLEGILVLAGWALDVGPFKSVVPGLATMKPTTALAFLLAGFVLRQLAARDRTTAARRYSGVSALLVALLGLLALFECLLSLDLGVDTILFKDAVLAEHTSQPGRMAPLTAASFLLLGLAMRLSSAKGRFAEKLSQTFGLLVLFVSLVAVIGYIYGVQSLYRISGYSSMAVHTALTLLLLSFGLLAYPPHRGVVAIIASDGPGGRAARRLIPLATAIPFLLGWLRLEGERAGLYETSFGLALMVLGLIAIFSGVILWNARSLDRVEGERRLAEGAEREKGRLLQLILDRMSDGVVVADQQGHFLLFNRAAEAILGLGAADVALERWSEHYGIFGADGVSPYPSSKLPLARAIRGEDVDGVELIVRHARRPEGVAVSVSGRPLQDPEGLLRGGMALFSDITERRRLEETRRRTRDLEEANRRAEQTNRLKSEFLANMSHELRTPLNAVIGFAELMHDAKVGPVTPDQKEFLGDILSSSRHLLQLINDVLDLSKVEAGKMQFRPERTDIHRLVGEVRDSLRSLASAKRIQIDTEIAAGFAEFSIDPGRFKQVLYNYLSNALKFTPEAGRVKVRITPEGGDALRLEVGDTGIGIKPEDLGRLFSEFQQLDASTAKRYAGTGLGLALTKRLVEAQGGKVGARSTPGAGSVFYAVLPQSTLSEQATSHSGPGRPSATGPRILVVEDEANDRELLERTLSQAGYAVASAFTGSAALELLRGRPFAAITLDLNLPDISGRDVLKLLRATAGPNRETP
ncbi:MAG TPA: ATP-binding protein, partial [Vicinamibacteria bacterium]|nr:ATP-binding protein [Vicinamibacteria bacterium]